MTGFVYVFSKSALDFPHRQPRATRRPLLSMWHSSGGRLLEKLSKGDIIRIESAVAVVALSLSNVGDFAEEAAE